ncbi:MAG: hypothetical protein V4819_19305 [Verrucomicrobiota bacterium]
MKPTNEAKKLIERARSFKKMRDAGLSVNEIAALLNITPQTVYDGLAALQLPDDILKDWESERLTAGAIKFLSGKNSRAHDIIMTVLRGNGLFLQGKLSERKLLDEMKTALSSPATPARAPLEIRLLNLLFGIDYREESLETIRILAAKEVAS